MARNYLHVMLDELDNDENLMRTPNIKRERRNKKKKRTLQLKNARKVKQRLQAVS